MVLCESFRHRVGSDRYLKSVVADAGCAEECKLRISEMWASITGRGSMTRPRTASIASSARFGLNPAQSLPSAMHLPTESLGASKTSVCGGVMHRECILILLCLCCSCCRPVLRLLG